MEARKRDTSYTYADYIQWEEGNRYELIDGKAYLMAAAPLRIHQRLSGRLYLQFGNFVKGKTCEVYAAPFDVRLDAKGNNSRTIVQPDLSVICDRSKLDDKGCHGAPDLIIEILSPSTAKHDTILKFKEYLQAGVREYWIVDPENKTVLVNVLEGDRYYITPYSEEATIPVHVLEGCQIDLSEVFAE